MLLLLQNLEPIHTSLRHVFLVFEYLCLYFAVGVVPLVAVGWLQLLALVVFGVFAVKVLEKRARATALSLENLLGDLDLLSDILSLLDLSHVVLPLGVDQPNNVFVAQFMGLPSFINKLVTPHYIHLLSLKVSQRSTLSTSDFLKKVTLDSFYCLMRREISPGRVEDSKTGVRRPEWL